MAIKKENNNEFILTIKSKAIVSLEDMLNGLKYLQQNNDLPRNLKILEDARKSKITFDMNDVDILIKNMNLSMQNFNKIMHAVIHDSPKNTALSMLVERKSINTNYKLMTFSTKEAALDWLNNVK